MSISKVEFLNASSSLIIVKIKTEKLGWKIARRFKFSKSAKNYNLKSILVSENFELTENRDSRKPSPPPARTSVPDFLVPTPVEL